MEIFLNLTNPVYVSSSEVQDEIKVRITNPYIFQLLSNNLTVKENFTTTVYLPSMIDSKDTDSLMKLGDYTKNSMVLTLIVPFVFMVFMSVSMESVWSLYLMLQIVSNVMHFGINRPGNAEYVMFVGQKISYFKVTEDKNI